MPTDWARELDRQAQERIAEAGFAQARAIEKASKRDYAAGYRAGFAAGHKAAIAEHERENVEPSDV